MIVWIGPIDWIVGTGLVGGASYSARWIAWNAWIDWIGWIIWISWIGWWAWVLSRRAFMSEICIFAVETFHLASHCLKSMSDYFSDLAVFEPGASKESYPTCALCSVCI